MSGQHQPTFDHHGHATLLGDGTKRRTNFIERHDEQYRKQWGTLAIQPARPIELEKRVK